MSGFGQSEMVDGQDVSLAAQGKVLAELLAYGHLDDPAVVAHDLGGAAALRAYLRHGARYRGLVLVDPVAVAPWESNFFTLETRHADWNGTEFTAESRSQVSVYRVVAVASAPIERRSYRWTPAAAPRGGHVSSVLDSREA